MVRTSVDWDTDVGGPMDGVTDCTAAVKAADNLAKSYGVRTVTLPSNKRLVTSTQKAGSATVIAPAWAHHWLGDPDTTEFVLAPGALKTQSVIFWQHTNHPGAQLAFRLNGQAALQMAGMADHDGSGNLQGFRAYGCRIQNSDNVSVNVSTRNLRSISATGTGSVFSVQSLGGQGGEFWVDMRTDDGSIGSEGIVFQGKTGGTPWILRQCISRNMWRGMGCYSGWKGEVHGLDVQDLSGPADAKAPGGQIKGNAMNIESGSTDTVLVTLYQPRSLRADQFLVVNGNTISGVTHHVGHVILLGGTSTDDGDCIVLVGGVAGAVDVSDTFFDSPTSNVLQSSNADATTLSFARATYRLRAGHALIGGGASFNGAWDLTAGTGGANTAPTLSNMTPAGGSTVTNATAVTVSCDASDNGPFSALTATGQTYLPAVNIASVTVSGTTATVVTSAAHGATAGGKVRLKTTGVPGTTGTFTVAALDGTTPTTKFTFAVASGTASSGAVGTVEPLGTTLTMAAKGSGTGFTGTWTPNASNGAVRRVEIVVADNDAGGSLSTTIAATVTVSTSANNAPLVAVIGPAPAGQVNPVAGQTLSAVVVDPNAGDTISATAWTVKDATATTVASGTLTAAAPAVSTTIATAVADVSTLTGEATDTVGLTSAAGTSSTGGVLAAVHGTSSIVVIAYGGVSGSSLTSCRLIAGSGALAAGDAVRSATHSATFDASTLTPGASYTAQATATDNHAALGASTPVTFAINTPPTVTWALPVAAQTIRGTVTLQVIATDDGGIANSHGGLYNMDTGSAVYIGPLTNRADGTLTYDFATTVLTDAADHTLRARIVDALGLVVTADVTFHVDQSGGTTGPVITGIMPAAGARVAGTVTVGAADITDPDGVDSASYGIGGGIIAGPLDLEIEWVASVNTGLLADGFHQIVITATDTFGNVTTAPAVPFTVANRSLPGSPDWYLATNPLTQVHDILAALDAAGRGDAHIWATGVGIPVRPAASGTNSSIVDSAGSALGVGYAPGDTIPTGVATSHRAISPTDAAARLGAHYARWVSTEFYDLTHLDYRTGPWLTYELADETVGWSAAWAAGADTNYMGVMTSGGGSGRWSGASK